RAKAVDPLAKAPSILTARALRAEPPPSAIGWMPVPICVSSPSTDIAAETAQPPGPGCRDNSEKGRPRNPRPAVNSEIASRQFVFPAPFEPSSTTGCGPQLKLDDE